MEYTVRWEMGKNMYKVWDSQSEQLQYCVLKEKYIYTFKLKLGKRRRISIFLKIFEDYCTTSPTVMHTQANATFQQMSNSEKENTKLRVSLT